jgi:hypothetical protein
VQPQRVPIVFYRAKGDANACGEGCTEWIAAEGYIDLGAAQRLKSFLNRNSARNLPIYFTSPGGLLQDALAIGRLLRARHDRRSRHHYSGWLHAGRGDGGSLPRLEAIQQRCPR